MSIASVFSAFTGGSDTIAQQSASGVGNAVSMGASGVAPLLTDATQQANGTLAVSVGTLSPSTVSAATAHKVLVGVLILIVMLILFTEVAGVNHNWAVMVGLLLVGALMLEGFTHLGNFATFAQNNPYIP